jgi:uncharacterized protein (TIGR00369 family)
MRKLNPRYVEAVSALVNRCPYFTLLSMSIRDLGIGYSLLDIDAQNKHLQPFEAVHGGVLASVIDSAAFWAVFCEVDENAGMTSVDLKVNYLAPAKGGKLVARGRRIKLGKTLALGEAEVINQEDNAILAHGTSTLMILRNLGGGLKHSLPPKFIEGE